MRVATAILVCLTCAISAHADPPAPRDLSDVLAPLGQKYALPGGVGAIIHGDQLVALGSFGVRKDGDPTPFQPTDLIHLGSDTKAMTAILIGQLIDQNKLTLDTTMTQIFPELAAKMDPAMSAVTVRQLLDHDAGLPHDIAWGMINATHLSLPEQRRMAVQMALSKSPAKEIGKYSYSNVGFVLLGAIVETETGEPWEQAIQEKIFNPLHMDSAGFGAPGTPGQIDQPWGHIMDSGQLRAMQSDNLPVMAPAGEVHCSMGDWSKFIAETLKGAQGNPTLVSAATFKAVTTPLDGEFYAGGWITAQRNWAGGLTLTHNGSNTMWYCDVWIAPNKNFAVMFATNYGSDPADKACDDAVGTLIRFNAQLPADP